MNYKETVKSFADYIKTEWNYIRQSLVHEENGKEVVEEVEKIIGCRTEYETYDQIGEMILLGYMLGKRDVLKDIDRVRD